MEPIDLDGPLEIQEITAAFAAFRGRWPELTDAEFQREVVKPVSEHLLTEVMAGLLEAVSARAALEIRALLGWSP